MPTIIEIDGNIIIDEESEYTFEIVAETKKATALLLQEILDSILTKNLRGGSHVYTDGSWQFKIKVSK